MGSPKNTISSSKRRKAGDGTRRFSTRSRRKDAANADTLPSPVPLTHKMRNRHIALKILAAIATVILLAGAAKSYHKRVTRRRQLMEDLDSDRLLPGDNDKPDANNLLDELNTKAAKNSNAERNDDDDTLLPRAGAKDDTDAAQNDNADAGFEARRDIARSHEDSDSHPRHRDDGNLRQQTEHQHEKHASEHEHRNGLASDDESSQMDAAPERNEAEDEAIIKEQPSAIEWYTRDDLKGGQRPLCRIAKPCMLSNGQLAVPSWMQRQEALLSKCGLGTPVYYTSMRSLPGVRHVRMVGVDFALTIHPERFQEPTHALAVYFNEHLLKASFLFDTFAGRTHGAGTPRVTHCVGTREGNDCMGRPDPVDRFHVGVFVPVKMRTGGKNHAFALRLVDYLGRAHGVTRHATHLNLSTILVKAHRDQNEGLSATCFRSVLSADAMFRHLPPSSMAKNLLLSKRNRIEREPRPKLIPGVGKCQLNVGIIDVSDLPRGIQNVPDFKAALENIGRLALRGGAVNVELIRVESDTTLDEHVRTIQNMDVIIGGSGDELSSVAFLRKGALVFEVLQFGMNPDTFRSLTSVLGLTYFSLQSRPASESFKNCLETQVLGLRKKGVLGDSEYPVWWDPLMATWDAAAAEFTLSGKTDFDILANHSNIANFDSRHCAKMQSLTFNHEEAARSIMLQAKSLCDTSE